MLPEILTILVDLPLVDPVPESDEVKAGWLALVIFLLLGCAVALLGYFMSKNFKRVERNRAEGLLPEGKPKTNAPFMGTSHPDFVDPDAK